MFDADFEPLITAKSPRGGKDIIQSSANNFYFGVTLTDLKNFTERYRLNSRVVKENGKLVETGLSRRYSGRQSCGRASMRST